MNKKFQTIPSLLFLLDQISEILNKFIVEVLHIISSVNNILLRNLMFLNLELMASHPLISLEHESNSTSNSVIPHSNTFK
jgi:hypothetical protein